MVADATSALSDLQRQFFIQEILGHVDEVAAEASGPALVALQTTTNTLVDGIEASLTSLLSLQTTANTHIDGLEALLTSLVAQGTVAAAPFSALNITTATSTLVKTGAGTLDLLNVNALGTVASTTKVYDGIDATGVLLATINTLAVLGTLGYGCAFTTGLFIVTTGTVAPDITVIFK